MRRTLTVTRPISPSWGSRMILYGAIALILLAGYQSYIQIDTSRVWLSGILETNRHMGISSFEYLSVMVQKDAGVRLLLSQIMFLLAEVIIAVVAIFTRRSVVACAILMPVCALLYAVGYVLDLYTTDLMNGLKLLYGLPLVVIAVGCLLQMVHRLCQIRGIGQRREPRVTLPPIKRTTPDPRRQFRDAPGAMRMMPPMTQTPAAPAVRPTQNTQRLEKPVPERTDTHIGEPPAPAQPPRYQWKTVKKNDRSDAIGQ